MPFFEDGKKKSSLLGFDLTRSKKWIWRMKRLICDHKKKRNWIVKRTCDKLRIERYGRTSHDFFNFQRLQLSLLWLKMPLGCITCCAFLQARLLSSVVGEKNHVSLYLSIIKKKADYWHLSTLSQKYIFCPKIHLDGKVLLFESKSLILG